MRSKPRRSWVALVTATFLWGAAATLNGVSSAEAAGAFPPNRPTRVLVLGDSVMEGAASNYGPALPGRDVAVDAAVNRTTGQGVDVVAALGSDWDVVVVLLGHNDGGSPGVYQPAARRLLDSLAMVPRVVWLTLHEVRPYYRDVNAFLMAEASRRPNLRIADWSGLVGANPGSTAGDGLHLNSRGAGLMAGLVADQVITAESDFAPPPPPPPPPPTVAPTTVPIITAPPVPAASAALTAPTSTSPVTSNAKPSPSVAPPATRLLSIDRSPSQKQHRRQELALAVIATITAWALVRTLRRRMARNQSAG